MLIQQASSSQILKRIYSKEVFRVLPRMQEKIFLGFWLVESQLLHRLAKEHAEHNQLHQKTKIRRSKNQAEQLAKLRILNAECPQSLIGGCLLAQFKGTDVEGLANEVLKLLAESPYAARIEREVIGMKGISVYSHYINKKLSLTLRARLPFVGNLPNYEAYAKRNLAEIVRGYSPTKKSA